MAKIQIQQKPILPEEGLVRLPAVLAVYPVSKSTWWSGCRSGRYPAPVRNGRMTFWRASDIRALLAQTGEGNAA